MAIVSGDLVHLKGRPSVVGRVWYVEAGLLAMVEWDEVLDGYDEARVATWHLVKMEDGDADLGHPALGAQGTVHRYPGTDQGGPHSGEPAQDPVRYLSKYGFRTK